MKKYKRAKLDTTPGSPCINCEYEKEEKLVGISAPNKRFVFELIDACENCKKLKMYQEYTYLLHLQIVTAGSSFDARLIEQPKRHLPAE